VSVKHDLGLERKGVRANEKTSPGEGLVYKAMNTEQLFLSFLALLGVFTADEAVTGAEQFGNDEDIIEPEAAGFVPVVAVLVGTADGYIEERAVFGGLIAPDSGFECAMTGSEHG